MEDLLLDFVAVHVRQGQIEENQVQSLLFLLESRIPPGVYPASKVKAEFLGEILRGDTTSPYIDCRTALALLGWMGGGGNVKHLIAFLAREDSLSKDAGEALARIILISGEDFGKVEAMAGKGNRQAATLLASWAEAWWFADLPLMEPVSQYV